MCMNVCLCVCGFAIFVWANVGSFPGAGEEGADGDGVLGLSLVVIEYCRYKYYTNILIY